MSFFQTCCQFPIEERQEQAIHIDKNMFRLKEEKISISHFQSKYQHQFKEQQIIANQQCSKKVPLSRIRSHQKCYSTFNDGRMNYSHHLYFKEKSTVPTLNLQNCRYRTQNEGISLKNYYASPTSSKSVRYQELYKPFNSPSALKLNSQNHYSMHSSSFQNNLHAQKKLYFEPDHQNLLEKTKRFEPLPSKCFKNNDLELRQTKNVGKFQVNKDLEKGLMNFKASIVSVNDLHEQKQEVLEESMIIMDFFNPPETKLKQIQQKERLEQMHGQNRKPMHEQNRKPMH